MSYRKCLLIILLNILCVYTQTIPGSWSPTKNYKEGDVVLHNGVRWYAPIYAVSIPGVPTITVDTIDSINEVYDTMFLHDWERVSPPLEVLSSGGKSRFGPIVHRQMWNRIQDDGFVIKAVNMSNTDDFFRWNSVGASKERRDADALPIGSGIDIYEFLEGTKTYKYCPPTWDNAKFIHSSWVNFVKNKDSASVVKEFEYRRYLRYESIFREAYSDENGEERYKARHALENAIEQIGHNIGDAGVPFDHLFDGKMHTYPHDFNHPDSSFEHEGIQTAIEYEAFRNKRLKDFSNITGTIKEAIDIYEERCTHDIKLFNEWDNDNWLSINKKRAVPALLAPLGGANLVTGGGTNAVFAGLIGQKAADEFLYRARRGSTRDWFDTLLVGGKRTVNYQEVNIHGIQKNALALGVNVVVDVLLAKMPLENAQIQGRRSIGYMAGGSYEFSAWAKDPDAVRLKIIDGKKTIEYDPNLQKQGQEHETTYDWFINDVPVGSGRNFKFDVVSSDVLSTENEKVKLNSITIKPHNMDNITFLGPLFGLELKVRIRDDEYWVRPDKQDEDTVIVTEVITFFEDRFPVAKFDLVKDRCTKPFVAILPCKDNNLTPYVNEHGITVSSAFANPHCFNPVTVDAFKYSRDPDGNASDQIVKAFYDITRKVKKIESFGWDLSAACIRGINQSTTIKKKIGEDWVPVEEQIMLKNKFQLQNSNPNTITISSFTRHLTTDWKNDNSLLEGENLSVSKYLDNGTLPDTVDLPFDQNYRFSGYIRDDEGRYASQEISLPILTTPVISAVSMKISDFATRNLITKYENSTITLLGEGQKLSFDIFCYDPDNSDDKPDVEIGIRKRDDASIIDYTKSDWGNTFSGDATFTYRELIDNNFVPNQEYEVFVKVTDDDNIATGLDDGYGFSITKVGEFKLGMPVAGDVNLDGVVDIYDEAIVKDNQNKTLIIDPMKSDYLNYRVYGDLNSDGIINTMDLDSINKYVAE